MEQGPNPGCPQVVNSEVLSGGNPMVVIPGASEVSLSESRWVQSCTKLEIDVEATHNLEECR